MKKTVIIGATTNPARYAYLAANLLRKYNHEFIPVGIKEGEVLGQPILHIKSKPIIDDVNTVTLYIGPDHQLEWYSYILSLKPARVIFNPGTENEAFENLLNANNIEAIHACTLVMLTTGQF